MKPHCIKQVPSNKYLNISQSTQTQYNALKLFIIIILTHKQSMNKLASASPSNHSGPTSTAYTLNILSKTNAGLRYFLMLVKVLDQATSISESTLPRNFFLIVDKTSGSLFTAPQTDSFFPGCSKNFVENSPQRACQVDFHVTHQY